MSRRLITLAILGVAPLFAQVPGTVFLEDMTWPEVRSLIREGATTVLVPTGGTEQNGPHMVLGKHNYRVRHVAEQVARRLGKSLVAPVLPYAPAAAHMKYAGTIDLPPATYVAVLEQVARSLQRHGFTDIVIVIDSGVAREVMFLLRDTLNKEWAQTKTRLILAPTFVAEEAFANWLTTQGERKEDIGLHGGLSSTSLLLAVDPKHVRAEKLKAREEREGSTDGNPERATSAYGKKGLELMIDGVVRRINETRATSRPPINK